MKIKNPSPQPLRHLIAQRCADAYSADRYTSWSAVAGALLKAGYDERETESIMRSKWTRWAADRYNRYDRIPAKAIIEFMQTTRFPKGQILADAVAELVAGTFGGPDE